MYLNPLLVIPKYENECRQANLLTVCHLPSHDAAESLRGL